MVVDDLDDCYEMEKEEGRRESRRGNKQEEIECEINDDRSVTLIKLR